jgi:hypothetical protein
MAAAGRLRFPWFELSWCRSQGKGEVREPHFVALAEDPAERSLPAKGRRTALPLFRGFPLICGFPLRWTSFFKFASIATCRFLQPFNEYCP